MVRVREGPLGYGQGGVEGHTLLFQQPDELRDGHGRVRVVELDGAEIGEGGKIVPVVLLIAAQDILQRGRRENVLLFDTQPLALVRAVIGVEHAGDVLGPVFGVQRLDIVLGVEGVKVQLLLGLALPEPEGADVVGIVADDGHDVRDGQNGLVRKFHPDGVPVAPVAPGVAVLRPVVGQLSLGAVFVKALLEEAEAVAQAVAAQRQVHRRGGI